MRVTLEPHTDVFAHPRDPLLVVVWDGEGYFGFDRRYEETFSPVQTFDEARRWCLARFAERN